MLSFIGKIITQLREEQSISLEQLGDRSGVSIEKLRDIEGGVIIPSVGVMIKISRALGSRLGTLLDGQESIGAVVSRSSDSTHVENISMGKTSTNRHLDFFALAQGKKDRAMEPLIVVVDSVEANDSLLSEHEGEEFLYVLDGAIEVRYGSELHTLHAGDSIYYDSIVPHSLISIAGKPSKILGVVYTPY